jgi:hypothetical protein
VCRPLALLARLINSQPTQRTHAKPRLHAEALCAAVAVRAAVAEPSRAEQCDAMLCVDSVGADRPSAPHSSAGGGGGGAAEDDDGASYFSLFDEPPADHSFVAHIEHVKARPPLAAACRAARCAAPARSARHFGALAL